MKFEEEKFILRHIVIFLTEVCTEQKDYFDSNGVYLKSICTLRVEQSKQAAKAQCEAQLMSLASGDDFPDSESVLINRAGKEYPTGSRTIWINGVINGECSVLVDLTPGNYIRSKRSCSMLYHAYCEFNGEINLYWFKESNFSH